LWRGFSFASFDAAISAAVIEDTFDPLGATEDDVEAPRITTLRALMPEAVPARRGRLGRVDPWQAPARRHGGGISSGAARGC
jgi:hypothetical protein